MKRTYLIKPQTATICYEKERENPDLPVGQSYEISQIDKGLIVNQPGLQIMNTVSTFNKDILRGTRNLSFVLGRSLLRTVETIWILIITLECSNITASKSIRPERKMRPMEQSGVNFSTHGSESECSCFDQVLCIRV